MILTDLRVTIIWGTDSGFEARFLKIVIDSQTLVFLKQNFVFERREFMTEMLLISALLLIHLHVLELGSRVYPTAQPQAGTAENVRDRIIFLSSLRSFLCDMILIRTFSAVLKG